MHNQRKPTIAARVLPLAGQQLPAHWEHQVANYGGTFDRRPLSELWKAPQWSGQESLTKNARLTPVSWNDLFGDK